MVFKGEKMVVKPPKGLRCLG